MERAGRRGPRTTLLAATAAGAGLAAVLAAVFLATDRETPAVIELPRTPEAIAVQALGAAGVVLVQTNQHGELWLARNAVGGVCVMVRTEPDELASSCSATAPGAAKPLVSFQSRALGSTPNLVSGYVPGAVDVTVGDLDAPIVEDTFLVEVPGDVWNAQVTMADGTVAVIDMRPGAG